METTFSMVKPKFRASAQKGSLKRDFLCKATFLFRVGRCHIKVSSEEGRTYLKVRFEVKETRGVDLATGGFFTDTVSF